MTNGHKAHLVLMARYNQWMNETLLTLMAAHPEADFHADRGAFFGSVWGTLNHLIVADIMWMTRLNRHPAGGVLSPVLDFPKPAALNDRLYADYASYAPARRTLDALFVTYIETLSEDDLGSALRYNRANGDVHIKPLALTLSHIFNHQTHHRGQITTLLSQMGLDIGATDVHLLVPELDTDTQ